MATINLTDALEEDKVMVKEWANEETDTLTQTISGSKTYSTSPSVPTPVLPAHAVPKIYVDDEIAILEDAIGENTERGNQNANNISALAAGEFYQGTFTPTLGQEYPLSPDTSYSWYITGLTDNGYTFTAGDLIGRIANNADKIIYNADGEWSIINNVACRDDFYTVDTVAQLLALSPIDGATALVAGYTTANDGGGDTFHYDATQSAINNGGTILDGWVREYSGAVHTKWFGAKGDATVLVDGTDDTVAIQAAIDSVGSSGDVYLDTGIHTVTQLLIDKDIYFHGASGGIDDDRAILNGSWLKLKDNAGLTIDDAVLTITHDTTVTSTTKRNFTSVEKFGIYGNRDNNTNGNGMIMSAKNIKYDSVTIYECATTGLVLKDATPIDSNAGANAITIATPWIGYNSKYGIDCQREAYSGDTIIQGGHVFWNDSSGIYINQPNVVLSGVHVWWNLDGVTIDGTLSARTLFSGTRIYDNARAGIDLINSVKEISIGGDIHGNGNESRWTYFSPALTSADISTDEQCGIYVATDATDILIDNVNFGYLNETGRQRHGVREVNSGAELSIGTVIGDGFGSTQTARTLSLDNPTNAVLHGNRMKSDMTHCGFIANGDIDMNANELQNVDKISLFAWDAGVITLGVLHATTTTVGLNEATAIDVTQLSSSIGGGLPIIIIRNGALGAVTFKNDKNLLRNISGADVVLNQFESIGYILVSGVTYQQIMGKI